MHLIIPMAGQGKRMRPHTLTTPKPLIPIAGKPIVARLVEAIRAACVLPIHTIGFVVSKLGPAIHTQLTQLAHDVGAEARFYEQHQAQGTAHAVLCAAPLLHGPVVVAFADTLFTGDVTLDTDHEGIVWVKKVKDPSVFGVVQKNAHNVITNFIEKPKNSVSDLAIIGIYYFREGVHFRHALQRLVDQDIRKNGEYQLTTALSAMQQAGFRFTTKAVKEWLDCGNKAATLYTNQRFLSFMQRDEDLVAATAQLQDSVLIPPVHLGQQVVVKNAVLGPYVSVGSYSCIKDARIQNSILQTHSTVANVTLTDSMVGNHVHLTGKHAEVSVGDYTTIMQDV